MANEEFYEEILFVEQKIIENIPQIETLEIFTYGGNGMGSGMVSDGMASDGNGNSNSNSNGNRIHTAQKKPKSENLNIFKPFWEYQDNDEYKDVNKFSICYDSVGYTFTRVSINTRDYKTFILVSKEKIQGSNHGMIIIRDTSGVMFVATCKEVYLRQMNLDLIAVIYDD